MRPGVSILVLKIGKNQVKNWTALWRSCRIRLRNRRSEFESRQGVSFGG
jgi:hypothetical protein